MSTRGRVAARVSLSVAAVAALSGGCAALDTFQHATTLTFRVDTLECGPAKAATVCKFFAYYGNVSKKPIQVDPASTKVVDRRGNVLQPVAEQGYGDAFLLKPGLQRPVSWSVTLPGTAKPAKVSWHGTSVPVLLDVVAFPSSSGPSSATPSGVPSTSPVPSATPSAAPPSAAATTSATTTRPKPTTGKPKPTTTKPKPTTKPTTARPTTKPPTTTPPPPIHTTTRPPVIHHTTPPTTNPTNPGGGSGGIG